MGAMVVMASIALSSCSGGDPADTVPLQILWTNDTHGYFLPTYHAEFEEIDTYAQTAATEGKIGGYAQIAGLVKKLKADAGHQNTLFLDGGDTFDGSPVAQLTRGDAVVPVLNAMGYDAMVPGNRDFAFSKADFLSVTGKISFPIVCANLLDTTTGTYVFPQYLIKQLQGLKVAIIGVTSPLANNTSGLTVLGGSSGAAGFGIETQISGLALQIRKQENPDLVIVISHLGYNQDRKFASRSAEIDVIVGAHTHHNIYDAPTVKSADGARDVIVVQAGSHGKFLGKLDLKVKNKKIVEFNNQLIRIVSKDLAPDPTVQALAEAAYAPFKAMLDEVIGSTTTVVERRGDVQSTMSNFLADATAEIFGVDGSRHFGIRYGSTIIPGSITVGDVWNMVSPNIGDNGMYVFTQTGTQIKATINSGLNQEYGPDPYNWPGGDVSRHNKQIKYTYKVNAPDNQHIVDLSITTTAGESVELVKGGVDNTANLARVFTFAATSGTPAQRVPNTTAVDEIVKYIQSKGTISPQIDDRAVRVD
jgi:2',3'-cyclic-nucleotide 2'-phosphodiesterase (5'-nucleotidase family)